MSGWVPIKSFPGYEASADGEIRRVKPGPGVKPGRVLKPAINSKGYLQVHPCLNGKALSCRVHRLVAEAFLGPCPSGYVVNHKDGNKRNNQIENLEYCTVSQDHAHAHRLGLNTPRRKLTLNQVIEIHCRYASGEAQADVARGMNVPPSTVGDIIRGKKYRRMQEHAGLSFGVNAEHLREARLRASRVVSTCPDCGKEIRGAANLGIHWKAKHGEGWRLNLSPEQRAARSERTREVRRKERERRSVARLLGPDGG